MKRTILLYFLALCSGNLFSQGVSVTTDNSNPDPSAILDIKSTSKGVLIPRLTSQQRSLIVAPAKGLMVFDSITNSFWYYNGTTWNELRAGIISEIIDTDGDTKIQVEESPDENMIRFDLGGGEKMILKDNIDGIPRLELIDINNNTFIGAAAGENTIAGSANTALGKEAFTNNTNGLNNTAIGYQAMYLGTTGFENTAIGESSLYHNTGGANTAVGCKALFSNLSGGMNSALGYHALEENTQGMWNSAHGYYALASNTLGQDNVALGVGTLLSNHANHRSTAIGNYAMSYADSRTTGRLTYNTAVGYEALRGNINASINTGQYNTAIGDQSLFSNTAGSNNTATGKNALFSNTIGEANTACGSNSLFSNTTGYLNTSVGYHSLLNNDNGVSNTSLGVFSMESNIDGNNNSAIGSYSLHNNQDGSYNTASGNHALYSNISGQSNSAIGTNALWANETGNSNSAFGVGALEWTQYSQNSGFGAFAGGTSDNSNNCTYIGFAANNDNPSGVYSNSTAIGSESRTTASNQVRLGSSITTSIGGYEPWTDISDGRYKKDIRENVPGLGFILLLEPVTYHLDVDKLAHRLNEDEAPTRVIEGIPYTRNATSQSNRDRKSQLLKTGFVAQDVKSAAETIGYEFSGIDAPEDEDGIYGLRYSQFVVPLVKAVQEQQVMIEELRKEIAELKNKK